MSLKVVTWNVNGLRASLKNTTNDLKEFLNSLEADVICLQETKATKDQLDSSTYHADGYNAYFSFCKVKSGYSGVVTFCRSTVTPVAAEEGLTGQLSMQRKDAIHCQGGWVEFTDEELSALDAEGRAVLTEHICQVEEEEGGKREGRVVVVNVYCPMVDSDNPDPERMAYKLRFYQALQKRCAALHKAHKLLIVVGDFNCSREPIDSAYIKEYPSLLTSSSPAREWMQQFAFSDPALTHSISHDSASVQLIDVFRYLHPTEEKAYTCWCTLTGARKTNYGTRIDYILASPDLARDVRKSEVWQQVEGSDHCPVFAEISLSVAAAEKPPSLCSCFFSEGKQTTLSAFFSKQQNSKPTAAGEKIVTSLGAGGSARGQKRNSTTAADVPAKARKKDGQSTAKGQTLLTLFKKTTHVQTGGVRPEEMDDRQESNEVRVCSQKAANKVPSQTESDLPSSQESMSSQTPRLSAEWQNVLSGPPKPPPCKGHNEPCVLRTVKKAGPNRNRQFWTCARPAGSKDDPQARCDFFKWVPKQSGNKT